MGKGIVKLGEGNWAVKDGNLLAAKETNGRFKNAEFTVARGTKATYVGRDGLIKESNLQATNLVQNGDFEELGDELITNGTFDTDSDWNLGTGWSIEDGKLVGDGAESNASQYGVVQNGNTYKITLTAYNITTGYISARIGSGGTENFQVNSNGTQTFYATADNGASVVFRNQSGFDGSIDNVSVKEVDPNDRWSLQTGWSIEDGKLVGDGTNTSFSSAQQNNLTVSGNTYKVTLTVEAVSGAIELKGAGVYTRVDTLGVGTHTLTFVADATYFRFLAHAGATATIDNISVQEIKTDTPRIDFTDNTDGHLLLEPQSTNLVTYSEDFSEWGESNATTTSNSATSPSGLLNADKVIASNSNSTHAIFVVPSVSASTTYTFSLYAKADEYERLYIRQGTGSSPSAAIYELSGAGSVLQTYGSPLDEGINNVGNGWYRITLTNTTSASTPNFAPNVIGIPNSGYSADEDGVTFLGDGTSGVYIWGAQLEELSYATSHIPTNGSQVTRDAETCTGAGEAIDFNSEEGVLYAEIAALADDLTRRIITITDGTLNNIVKLEYKNVSNQIEAVLYDGDTECLILHTLSDETEFNKIAFKYKQDDFSLFVNGIKVGTDTSGDVFAPNTLNDLSFYQGSINNFYGKCKAIRVYKEALSDSELTTLTS